jgi:hypothetical protein
MKKTLLFFLITGLAACSLIELPVEVTPAERKLVISSVMVGRVGILVTATRSFSPLDGRDVESLGPDFIETLLVRNGRLELRYRNRIDTLAGGQDFPGFYAGLTPDIQDGDALTLTVFDSLAGLTCRAETRLMPPVVPDSVRRDSVKVFNEYFQTLDMWFTDPPERNWYALHVYRASGLFAEIDSTVFFQGNQRVLFSEQFTDRSAEGGIVRRGMSFDGLVQPSDTLVVVLSNIEEGYFRFLDARRRNGGLVSALFSEPLNFPDNVENGHGYFSAHQPRAMVVYPGRRSLKV